MNVIRDRVYHQSIRVEVAEDSGRKFVEVLTDFKSNQWLSIFGAKHEMNEIFRKGLRHRNLSGWKEMVYRKKSVASVTRNPQFVEFSSGRSVHRAIEFSPKGIRIPARCKRVFERRLIFPEGDTDTSPGQASLRAPPWVAVGGIVGALQGHGNAMIAIQIEKSCGNCVLTVPLPLQGKSIF